MTFTRTAFVASGAVLLLLVGCGGEAPSKNGARFGAPATAALTYVPAVRSCPAEPPAGKPPSTRSSGYRVCGPFTAERGSATFACGVTPEAKGPFRLLVTNGAADGTGRASSASVRVNGVKALGPAAFDQQVRAATALVSLGASNEIEAAIEGPSGVLRLEIVDEGRACSILAATTVTATGVQTQFSTANAFPLPELQLFNGGPEGASPTNKGEVSLDGRLLVPRNEIREKLTAVLAPVSLASNNSLTARSGEKGLFSIQIVDRDVTPPGLVVGAVSDGGFTNQAQFEVTGVVDDPSAAISVNGRLIGLGGGSFSGVVTLAECWNTLVVAAADVCGNSREATIRVGLDTVPPSVGIVAPPAGLVTNQRALPVSLRFSDDFSGLDASRLRVTLDGADVTAALSVSADAVAGTLPVSEGSHLLRAEAWDRAGNVAVREAGFVVDLTPPTLSIDAPVDGGSTPTPVAVTITYADSLSGAMSGTLSAVVDGQDVTKSLAAGPVSASASLALGAGSHQLDASISDGAGNVASARAVFVVTASNGLPVDPSTIAPPLAPGRPTAFSDATAFLYTGGEPIQTGVLTGAIAVSRAPPDERLTQAEIT